jgi:transposase-like protein
MTPVEMSDPIYHDEEAARKHLEAVRWPNGPICPHCGVTGDAITPVGSSMGPGWYYCSACQDKFTVRVGTIWGRSHIPLHKWLLASRLMASSKKGVSAHQLHRTLNITYKSAWFLAHRIREAMRESGAEPIGGVGIIVEADETFIGRDVTKKTRAGVGHMLKVLSLVDRRTGEARSMVINDLKITTIMPLLRANIDEGSRVMTDEASQYSYALQHFRGGHEVVKHSAKEYVRHGDAKIHTNTIEGFFSIFKRGMKGVYQHCGEQHLQRYLHEFDFRYSNRAALGVDDAERTTRVLKGAAGKRLTYREAGKRATA